jgi:hypothetical protein
VVVDLGDGRAGVAHAVLDPVEERALLLERVRERQEQLGPDRGDEHRRRPG